MSAPARPPLRRLVKRSQFLRAARGSRAGRPAFGLQAIGTELDDAGVGFTVTKKVGNSPERSRIKRRLRAVAAACAADFHTQFEYVLVGRREALAAPFSTMIADLGTLLTKVHANTANGNPPTRQRNAKP